MLYGLVGFKPLPTRNFSHGIPDDCKTALAFCLLSTTEVCISPISPLCLPYISPISAYISPRSPLYLRYLNKTDEFQLLLGLGSGLGLGLGLDEFQLVN